MNRDGLHSILASQNNILTTWWFTQHLTNKQINVISATHCVVVSSHSPLGSAFLAFALSTFALTPGALTGGGVDGTAALGIFCQYITT